MTETIPRHPAVRLRPRHRRWLKQQTNRHIRREAKRDANTPLGIDARSRTRGWAD